MIDKKSKNNKKEFNKRIYKFMLDLVKFVDDLSKDSVTKILSTQLLRSGTSVGANYFEAKSSSSKREFIHYFQISLKSANETVIWLNLLRDSEKSDMAQSKYLIDEINEIANIFASSILTMKGKR